MVVGRARAASGRLLVTILAGKLSPVNKMAAKFALVRWTGEENLSVVSANSVRQGQDVYVGVFGDLENFTKERFFHSLVIHMSDQLAIINRSVADRSVAVTDHSLLGMGGLTDSFHETLLCLKTTMC